MRFSAFFFALSRFLLPPAIIGSAFLYLYPVLLDCSFPAAKPAEAGCSIPGQQRDVVPGKVAPFRLLALGDPQLEGDTSLPDQNAPLFPSLSALSRSIGDGRYGDAVKGLAFTVGEMVQQDIPRILKSYRKRVDLWGNDLYLAHIYRSVSWWSQPTHIVVLGDLLGSQWIGDDEFRRRSDRFWNVVFKGAEKLPPSVTHSSGRVEVVGADESWKRRIIAVAGNHDIGYAGDIDRRRIERFEDAFGSVNWAITFKLDNTSHPEVSESDGDAFTAGSPSPELRLIVLNSMNLDSPAKDAELQQQSRDFAVSQLAQSSLTPASGTILLTHIPFHKEAGVCVDETLFTWFPEGGIREQNHLSKETSAFILNGLTSGSGNAIVLNGHDHEGCDTSHHLSTQTENKDQEEPSEWHAQPFSSQGPNSAGAGLREITVRSMMGSFSGNAGFLSAWFDHEVGEWRFEYNSCTLGVQHIWWAVHILDLVVVGLGVGGVVASLIEGQEARGKGKLKMA